MRGRLGIGGSRLDVFLGAQDWGNVIASDDRSVGHDDKSPNGAKIAKPYGAKGQILGIADRLLDFLPTLG